MNQDEKLPLVYSCSGASSAAQMANHIAVKLDRLNVAEMSCIAGVGGDVKSLVRTAQSGRPIIALDGCPLHCVAAILKRHGLAAAKHFDLSRLNVKKRFHEDFDPAEATHVLQEILADPEIPKVATRTKDCRPVVAADNEPHKFASPPCYLSEFADSDSG